jgi:hypothetical protein
MKIHRNEGDAPLGRKIARDRAVYSAGKEKDAFSSGTIGEASLA